MKYTTVRLCGLCGEKESEAVIENCKRCRADCFHEVIECPECDGYLGYATRTVHGIETYRLECDSCDYVGEPE